LAGRELAGTRIRERRIDLRIRQADLARDCGISPSYLNLIEHNRRRIAGKLLADIARRLEVDPAVLSEGAGAARLQSLRAAVGQFPGLSVEYARAEEFAGRFPGWAQLVSMQSDRVGELERTIQTLSDRLAHDPYISASLHDVLSTVTSIRSTSAILAGEDEIPPDWQKRFHRNLYEDSQRLAETSQAFVNYLDAGADTTRDIKAPQDEIDAWLRARDHRFDELEEPGEPVEDSAAIDTRVTELVTEAAELQTASARGIAREILVQYRCDAADLPREVLTASLGRGPIDPGRIAAELNVSAATVLRRLASLPSDVPGVPLGLVVADLSGAFLYRKEIDGFPLPRFGAGCPLWPLYQTLLNPLTPIAASVVQQGSPERRFRTFAIGEPVGPVTFGRPVVHRSVMLIVPEAKSDARDTAIPVGSACRICPRDACPARREPSVLSV